MAGYSDEAFQETQGRFTSTRTESDGECRGGRNNTGVVMEEAFTLKDLRNPAFPHLTCRFSNGQQRATPLIRSQESFLAGLWSQNSLKETGSSFGSSLSSQI